MLDVVDQIAHDRAVQRGDQRRDEQPGRCEVDRNAEEPPDPQQRRLARAGAPWSRLHGPDRTAATFDSSVRPAARRRLRRVAMRSDGEPVTVGSA